MKVSIIIPVYNKGKYIRRTLHSVLTQTYENFEVLIIDDGSTDTSASIVKDISQQDSRVKYYYQKNSGVSIARNLGLVLASGYYVSFLDADDYWLNNFLEEMINSIGNGEACYCGHYNEKNDMRRKARFQFKTGDILTNYINNVTTPNTNSWLLSLDYIKEHNILFDEGVSWGEDMTFFLKIITHSTNIKTTSSFLSVYINDVTNHLSEIDIEKIRLDIEWMEKTIQYLEQNISNSKRLNRAVRAFRGYRIPASIIYKLLVVIEYGEIEKIKMFYDDIKPYLVNISFFNNLRSVKLILNHFKLKRYIESNI